MFLDNVFLEPQGTPKRLERGHWATDTIRLLLLLGRAGLWTRTCTAQDFPASAVGQQCLEHGLVVLLSLSLSPSMMRKLCENKIVSLQGGLGVCPKHWLYMFLVLLGHLTSFTYGLVDLLAEGRRQKAPLIAMN